MKHSNRISTLGRFGVSSCLVLLLVVGSVRSSQARLSELYAAFRERISSSYDAAGQRGNNFFFKLKLTAQQQRIAPGYAAWLTVTVAGDRIVGESMVFYIGRNHQLGCTIATLDAFAFTCEATGKPLPNDKRQSGAELTAFTKIVQQAFAGHPQTYSYPGYRGTVLISVDHQEKLTVACAEPQPAAPAPPPPSSPKPQSVPIPSRSSAGHVNAPPATVPSTFKRK